jgi:hypothetical protein
VLPAPIPALGEFGPAFARRHDEDEHQEHTRSAVPAERGGKNPPAAARRGQAHVSAFPLEGLNPSPFRFSRVQGPPPQSCASRGGL